MEAGAAGPEHTTATLPSVTRAGTLTNLFVTVADAHGNPRTVGGDDVVVTMLGANRDLEIAVTDNGDGTYTGTIHADGGR